MEIKTLKGIDIQKDYLLYQLFTQAKVGIRILCDYMQSTTPYGTAYKEAFKQYKKVLKELAKLEHCLQDCVEAREEEE